MMQQTKKIRAIIVAFCVSCLMLTTHSVTAEEEIAVITHTDNTVELPKELIAKIFLDKEKFFPGGKRAVPMGHEDGDQKFNFYKRCTNKSPDQVKAYWARRIFTGKGLPPEAVIDDEEMIELVSSNPNIIGYVNKESIEEFKDVGEVRVVTVY